MQIAARIPALVTASYGALQQAGVQFQNEGDSGPSVIYVPLGSLQVGDVVEIAVVVVDRPSDAQIERELAEVPAAPF